MDTIKFDGNNYPIKELNFPFGNRLISVTELNNAVVDNISGDYVSDKARYIDESIFYFIGPHQFSFKDEHLVALVLSQLQ